MKIQLTHKFEDIISVENLLLAWQEFIKGKRNKPDVQIFSLNLMDNILQLHQDLASKAYIHGDYYDFYINDPKPRHIHKATVRDRYYTMPSIGYSIPFLTEPSYPIPFLVG